MCANWLIDWLLKVFAVRNVWLEWYGLSAKNVTRKRISNTVLQPRYWGSEADSPEVCRLVLWWPFWKWRPVEIFQCRESIRDIIMDLKQSINQAIFKMATTIPIGKPRVSPLRFLNTSAVIRYLICVYASHFFAGRPCHFNQTLRTANKFWKYTRTH
jgi:hypothetical protein